MTKDDSLVLGIDLGTTRSVSAIVDDTGKPQTIQNSEGDLTTPSVVLFEDDCVSIGKEALKAAAILPDQVARFAKREMGKDTFSHEVNGQAYPPEMIQSLILGRLRRDAESRLGQKVQSAVITVPAYFDEPKRRSTMDAGLLAGLDVKAVINEPTAAAIAFGMESTQATRRRSSSADGSQTILVYDLGGGTFDASIVRVDGNKIDVIATDGNGMLGGMDWDKCLSRWLDAKFAVNHNIKPSETATGEAMLWRESEDIKHSLTSRKRVDLRVAYEGHLLSTEITRDEFEEITAHLLDRTRFTVRKLVQDAKLSWIEIDKVVLVGGSTRMPQVSAMLLRESGIEPDSTVSADEAVAHGAAIYAATLADRPDAEDATKLTITDVNAHNLGVLGVDKVTGSRCNHVMIPRNTPLPAAKATRFETIRDDQPSVAVEVIEGGDARGQHATQIGRCVIHDLPSNLPAGTPVDVLFRYDTDGLINVKASLPTIGQQASLRIDRASGLSSEERTKMRDIHLALGLDPDDDEED
ncbi:MAG: Hsp70 family protein [Rubripirellula sp.]